MLLVDFTTEVSQRLNGHS